MIDYNAVYRVGSYRMGQKRRKSSVELLSTVPRGTYLDIGCGRGEMLEEALELGFYPVTGVEIVDALIHGDVIRSSATELPFASESFDVASLFDVIEHLEPGDDERACKEARRVSRGPVLISTSNRTSIHNGVDLHINKRPYEEWDRLLYDWIGARRVPMNAVSEFWIA